MAYTEKGVYYQTDYDEDADILEDMKKMAESVDDVIENSEEGTNQALANKVDKVQGKGLSTNDYDDTEQGKVQANTEARHTHSNKSILDGTTASYTTEKDAKLAELENYDDSELREEIDQNATNIQENYKVISKIKKELAYARANEITDTVSGEDVYLKDSAKDYLDLDIIGHSEQESTTGKNLIYPTETLTEQTINGVKFTPVYDDNGSLLYVNGNGTATADANYPIISSSNRLTLPAGSYIANGCNNGSSSTYMLRFSARNISTYVVYTQDVNFTLSTSDDFWINAEVKSGTTVNNVKFYPMVRPSTITDDTYEPFTGGQPAPSPSYPYDIKSCGENGNVFDITKRLLGTIDDNGDLVINGTTAKFYEDEFEENIPYTLSAYVKSPSGSVRFKLFYTDGTSSDYVLDNRTDNYQYMTYTTQANKTLNYIAMNYGNVGQMYIKNAELKLEPGTQATPYSPYGCGNVNVKVENGNIFDEKQLLKAQGWTENNGVYSGTMANFNSAFGSATNGFDAKFKENTQYILKFKGYVTGGVATISFYYTDGSYHYVEIPATILTEYTLTSRPNKTIAKMTGSYGTGGSNTLNLTEMMLNEGTTAQPYQPHSEQNISFPLAQGQKLMEGDYLADDGVHHVMLERVLDGTEEWEIYNSGAYSTNPSFNMILTDYANVSVYPKCNILIGQDVKANSHCAIQAIKTKLLCQPSNNILTLEDWKAYLSEQYANGTPVIVQYELAEEVIDPYTEEQQTVYDQIQELHTYKGGTYISSPDEVKPKLDVTFTVDTKAYIDNKFNELSNAVVALGGV